MSCSCISCDWLYVVQVRNICVVSLMYVLCPSISRRLVNVNIASNLGSTPDIWFFLVLFCAVFFFTLLIDPLVFHMSFRNKIVCSYTNIVTPCQILFGFLNIYNLEEGNDKPTIVRPLIQDHSICFFKFILWTISLNNIFFTFLCVEDKGDLC